MTARTVEVCTTYNKAYYKLCAKEMVQSFIKYWPKECTLHVYWQEQEPEIFQDNIVYHELYKVQPQLKEFVDKWKDDPVKMVGEKIEANTRGKIMVLSFHIRFLHKPTE